MLKEQKLDATNEQRLHTALQFQQSDQPEKALTHYQIILKSYPGHAMILHLIGITFAQTDQLDFAIDHFQQSITKQPNNPIYHASLANAYRRKKNIDHAIEHFQIALDLNPSLVSAHNNLALIYFSSDPEKAQSHLEQALKSRPDHCDANYNLGLLLISRNKHKAKYLFKRVIDVNPSHVSATFQLAQLYHAEKSYLKALPLYEKIIDIQPDDPECLNKIGLIHLAQDRFDEGLACLQKAFKINPELTDIHHNLACLYLHKKEYQKALTHWMKYLKTNQDNDTYYNIGVCYLYLGRYDDCTAHLFHVIKKDPNHYKSLINLGAAFLQKNHPSSACIYYKRAQEISPTPAIAHILSALQQSSKPDTMPSDYVVDLFDNYAFHYDNHLCDVLDYQLPKHIQHLIQSHLHLDLNSLFALDLGCGTGLSGQVIRPFCSSLIGIDLSPNMIEIAQKKSIYDQLICADIMATQAQYSQKVDLLLTADTVPYFGDLHSLFQLSLQYLKSDGYWILSIESDYSKPYDLMTSARFSHSPDYIIDLASQYGFSVFHSENVQLRTQQNQYITGMLFALQRN